MPKAPRFRCDAKDFSKHMCTLPAQGRKDCFQLLSQKPRVECRKCGAKAASEKNICAADVLPMAPDIDGLVRSRDVSVDPARIILNPVNNW